VAVSVRLQLLGSLRVLALSSLQLASKLVDLRHYAFQLAFEFVDPRCPLPGHLDQGSVLLPTTRIVI
jgi:hypothetical protein